MPDDIQRKLIETYDRYEGDRDVRHPAAWKLTERSAYLQRLREADCQTLLEIGAGTGKDGLFFQEQGFEVVSTDLSSEMVRLCHAKGVPSLRMDFQRLAFREASLDAIWSMNCLLHVPSKQLPDVLKGLRRVLKPGGLFYLGVYGKERFEGIWQEDYYEPKRFFCFYPDAEIQSIVSQWFEVLAFNSISVGAGKAHFQSMTLRNPRKS